MTETVSRAHFKLNMQYLIYTFYLISVALITHTLIIEHHEMRFAYLAYPITMMLALFHRNSNIKELSAVLSMGVILVGGYLEPLELDAIEEVFILIPLTYLIVFPGSMWPISSALLLILSYLYELPEEDFSEFVEDAIELIVISVFATVMTYYQQKFRKQMIRYRKDSLTDFLTEAQNRKAFFLALETLQTDAKKDHALIQIDLDNFKLVNESLGHANADILLKKYASYLLNINPLTVSVYRLSGDEFMLLIEEDKNLFEEVSVIEDHLSNLADQTYVLGQYSYKLTFSVGIALLSDAMQNTEILCKNVDAAVEKAKASGKNTVRWYDNELLNETVRQHQVERELASALQSEQLHLVYQPKVDIKSHSICGAEALIRWKHPDLGVISPIEFIEIAEKSKLIVSIGRWVILTAATQAKHWQQLGHELCVSVNVSTVQFAHDDMYQTVTDILEQTSLPAHLLQLEITETTLMQQPEHIIDSCNKLRELGVTIAIDDFGVAYSSLNYLKQLPIDVLKIDKSFIDECVKEHDDHMIVRTIIQLGHNMGKTVIAEGVEDADQLKLLELEECNHFQGYLFSKPLICEDFTQLLSSGS
ncbi:bifunctional diguanylate cyclase/phosphodiesterase [Vibrio makurazakiensis]|uniref:putative bifunctional diguanylate cyclase/phosphodiesterase n=1 Tax=Vibrio makurazakiensis TaxID=2910250 RepID=UPI003D149A9B